MNAPQLPKQYTAYPPPRFHITQAKEVPPVFNPKQWTPPALQTKKQQK